MGFKLCFYKNWTKRYVFHTQYVDRYFYAHTGNVYCETIIIYRLAFAEAHAYIALEAYIVGTRELKRVETGQQRLGVTIVVPFAEYRRVGRTSVLVCHDVLVFNVVFDRFRNTAPGKPSVDTCRTRLL